MALDDSKSSQSAPDGADSRSSSGTYGEDIRNLKSNARATVRGGVDSFGALRRLAMAELNLSRHAVGRSMVWLAVAIAFGASFWLFLMAGAVVAMHDMLGWSWLLSLFAAAAASLIVMLVGALRVKHYFGYTGLDATRRELALFGIGDEPDESDAKPSFASLQKRVDRAEFVAEGRRQQTVQAYTSLRSQARAAVTPGRVMAAGAISGYLVGRRGRGESDRVVQGRIRRTGLAAKSALYTTDMAMRGMSELASLAITTFAAFKSSQAADSSSEAADASSAAASASSVAASAAVDAAESVDAVTPEPSRASAAWDPEDLSNYKS